MRVRDAAPLALLLLAGPALAQIQGQFTPTGSQLTPRLYGALVPLPGGNALAIGGTPTINGTSVAETEIYNARKGGWSATGSMATAREEFASAVIAGGRVLVAGGVDSAGAIVGTAELYDPKTGAWGPAGNLVVPRALGAASVLADGRVLLAGGCTGAGCASLAAQSEIYDPKSNTWSGSGSLAAPRELHGQVTLASGQVLVVGGTAAAGVTGTAELFDPASGTWSAAASLTDARTLHTTTLLADGRVLVTGGVQTRYPLNTTELYDPNTNAWSLGQLTTGRYAHSATLLPDGTVLVAGGYGRAISCGRGCTGYIPFAAAEIYNETTNSSAVTGSLNQSLAYQNVVLAGPGVALVEGGETTTTICCVATPNAELYAPLSLSISAYALDFGFLQIGRTSPAQTVNVTNVSNHTVSFTSIAASGDFSQLNDCPATLTPGQGCAINVTFTPTAMGARKGTLTLLDNSPGSPKQVISLTGTGEVLALGFSPASINFGGVLVGSTGQMSATLINAGTAPVSISGISIAPVNKIYTQTNNCPSVLGVQQSCTLQVTFTPPDVFTYKATLSAANSAGAPAALPLVGHGLNN